MGVRLPAEYQEVEYLESTGTQYINLGIYADQNTVAICEVLLVISSTYYYGGGDRLGDNTFECYYWGPSFQFNTYNTNIQLHNVDYNFTNNSRVKVMQSASYVSLEYDGVTITRNTGIQSDFQTEYPVYLFALNRAVGVNCSSARIYNVKFYQGETNIRHCIPCYRKADSKPGMYDLVSGTFFTNQGTGEFLVGPDVIDSISPWLVTRRRALMARVESGGEEWDLILTAQADGTIPSINLKANPETSVWWGLKRGESVTIAYDMTGFDGGENRVFVECDNNYLFNRQIKQSELQDQVGEMTFANTYPGNNTPTFLISRAWANSTEPYRFKGRYIKVRINHVN